MGLWCGFRGPGFVWCFVIRTIIENEKKILRERLRGRRTERSKMTRLYTQK